MYDERMRQLIQTVARTVMIDILLPYRMYDAAYVVTRLSELQPTDDNRTYRFPTSTSSCRLWNLYIDAIQHGVYAAIPTSDATTGTTDWMMNTNPSAATNNHRIHLRMRDVGNDEAIVIELTFVTATSYGGDTADVCADAVTNLRPCTRSMYGAVELLPNVLHWSKSANTYIRPIVHRVFLTE